MKKKLVSKIGTALVVAVFLPVVCRAQVNSGSNGSDGAFNPTTNTIVNMADHPSGIYQYTTVNIPSGVTVTFLANANNTPVVWLVQEACVISGTIDISGKTVDWDSSVAGIGGPGGFRGGGGVNGTSSATDGQGPGGGVVTAGAAAFGTFPTCWNGAGYVTVTNGSSMYGNQYIIPIVGGSGGGGSSNVCNANGFGEGGGGGGGAILIASSGTITLNGSVNANGGGSGYLRCGYGYCCAGGAGSGGAVRLAAPTITGTGSITASGGNAGSFYGGMGRVRFDSLDRTFSGGVSGSFSAGFQPIIIPTPGLGAQLNITSLGSTAVTTPPGGVLSIPDAIISSQQASPIPVVVSCANIPLNTAITVSVRPASGATVAAVGHNSTGTQASSTATVLINVPRGGGIIYATAATSN